MVDFLNDNSGFATSLVALFSFLATLALVLVTLVYAHHTRRLAEVSKEPDIQPWLYPRSHDVDRLRVINCGTGPAVDVEVALSYSNAVGTVTCTWPFMGPGQLCEFKFVNPQDRSPIHSPDELRRLGRMKFVAKYRSLDGPKRREFRTTRDIDLDSAVASSMEAQMLVTEDLPDHILVSIRDEVRKLTDQIGKLHRQG